MLLLAADTSGKNGSIALAQAHKDGACNTLEIVPLQGGTFSAQLVPQIAALLGKHGLTKRDIGGFAVVSGPGSFTGLRVGLAAIKALAEVLSKPIATVSLLEAVAASGNLKRKVLAALDAGRNEIYAGEYEIEAELKLIQEKLLSRDEFLAVAADLPVVTPDAGLVDIVHSAGGHVEVIVRPRSDAIARLGWHKIQAGIAVLPEHVEANYIRRSDAEIFAKPSS